MLDKSESGEGGWVVVFVEALFSAILFAFRAYPPSLITSAIQL